VADSRDGKRKHKVNLDQVFLVTVSKQKQTNKKHGLRGSKKDACLMKVKEPTWRITQWPRMEQNK
jgi:hypothetical protein